MKDCFLDPTSMFWIAGGETLRVVHVQGRQAARHLIWVERWPTLPWVAGGGNLQWVSLTKELLDAEGRWISTAVHLGSCWRAWPGWIPLSLDPWLPRKAFQIYIKSTVGKSLLRMINVRAQVMTGRCNTLVLLSLNLPAARTQDLGEKAQWSDPRLFPVSSGEMSLFNQPFPPFDNRIMTLYLSREILVRRSRFRFWN